MNRKIKIISLFKKLSLFSLLGCIFGLFGIVIFSSSNSNTGVNAENISQVFLVLNTGDVNTSVAYTSPNNYYNELNFTYRYELWCRDNGNNTLSFKPKIFLTYDTCYATDLDFTFYPYENPISLGHEQFIFDGIWTDSIPSNASFNIMAIQDLSQGYDRCNVVYDITNTIQGDFWSTYTIDTMFITDNDVNITGTIYPYVNFPYDYDNNRLVLFDVTSQLDSISLLDIYYQRGYQDGYNNGWVDGEVQGETAVSESSYTDGYAHGVYEGYNQGYLDGQNSIGGVESQWYNNGYQAGYDDGYSIGFNADSTAASIFSGILQIGLLPINFFLAIFNFEILGINLSGFIRALFTVAITIIVIKTIFGGKGASD